MEHTNTTLLRNLSASVNGHAAAATFACGGSVDGHVTIRWDSGNQRKISFPFAEDDTASQRAMTELVQHCQPATFGLDDRDVLDENYRKAIKLDNAAFSTNFHPHDHGIVDAVEQILMPSTLASGNEAGGQSFGVRAELYKLNVSSTPVMKELVADDMCVRSIQHRQGNSCLMWILPVARHNLDHWLSACPVHTKVGRCAFAQIMPRWVCDSR